MTGPDRRIEDRAVLRAQVAGAARVLSPLWPIGTFVAVNPLGGLTDRPFEEAVETAAPVLGIRGMPRLGDLRRALDEGRVTPADVVAAVRRRDPAMATGDAEAAAAGVIAAEDSPAPLAPRTTAERVDAALGADIAATVDAEAAKWCAAFAGEDEEGWRMPGRERGFYAAWRALAGSGPALRRLALPGVRERLAALPEAPEDALLEALRALRVPREAWLDELRGHFGRQPGWASVAAWHEDRAIAGFDLVQLLAVRATYEAELVATAAADAGLHLAVVLDRSDSTATPVDAQDALAPAAVALAAREGAYADRLLASLERPEPPARAERPDAQAIFCIDARSEGLRRHLEALGSYETLGFAGFFAVAMSYRALGSRSAEAQAPVLLDPRYAVAEVPSEPGGDRFLASNATLAGAEHGLHRAKEGVASPFALAEIGGWAAGPLAAAKTLAGGAHVRLRARARAAAAPAPATELDVDGAIPVGEQVAIAHAALTMMGLTSGFARLVLLCGHGSTTENNPYAAALDCGACGGHEGAPNARAAATILNRPAVRAGLEELGIAVPADTWFVAGRHDTTTDDVELLDRHLVPAGHRAGLEAFERALRTAGDANAAERAGALPGAGHRPAARDARRRAADWAQLRPEWGLARNAAFIAGPRELTAGLDLGCRTFLHSYDHRVDADGTALETILTAPLVVAQWINAQYYFSTTDPDVLGAGDKAVHNVVAGIGVLEGSGGDVRLGLPRQACFAGERPYHEPLRLLAVVQAPLSRIDALIARNEILRRLFGGEWVHLAAREDFGNPWRRWTAHGWEGWRAPAAMAGGATA